MWVDSSVGEENASREKSECAVPEVWVGLMFLKNSEKHHPHLPWPPSSICHLLPFAFGNVCWDDCSGFGLLIFFFPQCFFVSPAFPCTCCVSANHILNWALTASPGTTDSICLTSALLPHLPQPPQRLLPSVFLVHFWLNYLVSLFRKLGYLWLCYSSPATSSWSSYRPHSPSSVPESSSATPLP